MLPPPALERQQLVAKQDRSPPRFSRAFLAHKNDLHAATLDTAGFNVQVLEVSPDVLGAFFDDGLWRLRPGIIAEI